MFQAEFLLGVRCSVVCALCRVFRVYSFKGLGFGLRLNLKEELETHSGFRL